MLGCSLVNDDGPDCIPGLDTINWSIGIDGIERDTILSFCQPAFQRVETPYERAHFPW